MLFVVFVTFVVTLVGVLVALNFTTGEKKIEQKIERLYPVGDPQFLRAMGVLLGPAIVGGNRFEVLLNGDRIFPAMLGAIRGAQKTITFESYIYWSGTIGQKFADALAERARAGIKVHVLLDWIGSSKMEAALLREMEEAGVEVRKFHQPHWYHLARLNNRTHRKVLVADGKTGGAAHDSFVQCVLRAGQVDAAHADRRPQARRQGPDHHAGRAYRFRNRPQSVARAMGRAARGGSGDL
jgi:cardiolipin synthase